MQINISSLAFKYILLSFIGIASNIGAQNLVVSIYSGVFPILTSVVVGTFVGLVVKYILDKRYIFYFRARGVVHDTHTFALYAIMGVATTLIFWCFEFGFHLFFNTNEMRYLGGVIGLAIGYLIKFHLDKRFVFRAEAI